MPRNKSIRGNKRGNRPRAKIQAKQLDVLNHISDNTAALQRATGPRVPDPQRIQFSEKDKVYTFSRRYVIGNITPSATVDQAGAYNFTLSAFPDSAEFTSLFDMYRIVQLTVEFIPLTQGPYNAPLTSIIDYDDSNAVANLNELLEYQSSMTSTSGATHVRTFTPHVSTAVYGGAFTNFATAPNRLWIDAASSNTQYYGLKYYLPALTGGTTTAVYTVYVTGILQFKRVR